MSGATVLVAARDVMTADFSPEVVLLNLHDGMYYGVEDVGARVWALVQTPIALADIVDTVIAEFDVEPSRGEREVRAFLQELVERGLVRECADAR
ncbi:MAG TPA: PqqD family protein [Vicinamibacterales bacterium]|nr:PqqD family protein [Vicinamibacterales bacterium]